MAVHGQRYVTPEEYLALERAAERKSEYRDGEIQCQLAMAEIYDKVKFGEIES
jgi:hypothetical protein